MLKSADELIKANLMFRSSNSNVSITCFIWSFNSTEVCCLHINNFSLYFLSKIILIYLKLINITNNKKNGEQMFSQNCNSFIIIKKDLLCVLRFFFISENLFLMMLMSGISNIFSLYL